jgi:small ligand-binding sensory domain FIST
MSGRDAPTGARFASASATGEDWRTTVKACLDKLGPVDGCNLGFLYISDALAADAVSIVTLMRGVTGIKEWVGTVGIGICATGEELFDRPAIAVMAAQLPPGSFHLPAPIMESIEGFAP